MSGIGPSPITLLPGSTKFGMDKGRAWSVRTGNSTHARSKFEVRLGVLMKTGLMNALLLAGTFSLLMVPATQVTAQSRPRQASTPTPKPTAHSVGTNSSDAARVARIQEDFTSLEKEVKELSKTVEGMRSELTRVELNQVTNSHSSVTIDPASPKSFQRLDSSAGSFFVSLSDVVPFLDGYKVILNVGNPLDVTYSGFTLDVKWGPRYDYSKFSVPTYKAWSSQLKEQKFPYADSLRPGAWNKVSIIISPAKAEDLGYLELSIETDTVQMYRRR